jgi:hypothetical protein
MPHVALLSPGKEQCCTLRYVTRGVFTLLNLCRWSTISDYVLRVGLCFPPPPLVNILYLQAQIPLSIPKEKEMILVAPVTPALNRAPFNPDCLNFP